MAEFNQGVTTDSTSDAKHYAQEATSSPESAPQETTGESTDRPDVLTPGSHANPDDTNIEIGNHEFAHNVVANLRPGCIYLLYGVPVKLTGINGKKTVVPLSSHDLQLVIDKNMKLICVKRDHRKLGTLVTREFVTTSQRYAAIVLAALPDDTDYVLNLEMVVNYPVYDRQFNLLKPGYNNGVFYDQPPQLKDLEPELNPSVIRATLEDYVIDFPFKNEASRQNYFGLLLTGMLRRATDGNVPFHIVLSSLERTGKSKLIEEGLGALYLGERVPAKQLGDSDGEIRKYLTGMLLQGTTLLHLDNLPQFLDSTTLSSFLTASNLSDRMLGSNKMVSLPNHLTVIGSGNNVQGTGEVIKRVVPIELQPADDKPELRTEFCHTDFYTYAKSLRLRLLKCLIGAVELWRRAGMPAGRIPMGGFDNWARITGGILGTLGYDQFMGNVSEWRQKSNLRKKDLDALVDQWHRSHGLAEVTLTHLHSIVEELDLFPQIRGRSTEKAVITALGSFLAKHTDIPIGGFLIRRVNDRRPTKYSLQPGVELLGTGPAHRPPPQDCNSKSNFLEPKAPRAA